MNLTPLTQLAHLTRLEITSDRKPKGPYVRFFLQMLQTSIQPSEHYAKALSQMPSLRFLRFGLGQWKAHQLADLCKQPHQLQQLEEIDLGSTHLTVAHMEALQNLPSLTSIRPLGMQDACIPLLSSFPSLRSVRIQRQRRPHATDAQRAACRNALLSTLPKCSQLTEVSLGGHLLSPGDEIHLSASLDQLPRFRSLQVIDAP
jgi:hypothetical protein